MLCKDHDSTEYRNRLVYGRLLKKQLSDNHITDGQTEGRLTNSHKPNIAYCHSLGILMTDLEDIKDISDIRLDNFLDLFT